GGWAEGDLGAGLLVEPRDARGEMDGVAAQSIGRAPRAADAARQHGPGVDADAVPERRLAGGRAPFVQASQSRPHGEGGGEGAVGVVRRAEGSPEHRLDLVADVLEDETALGADGHLPPREVLVEVW